MPLPTVDKEFLPSHLLKLPRSPNVDGPKKSLGRNAAGSCVWTSSKSRRTSSKFARRHWRSTMNPETLTLTVASQAIRDGRLLPIDYVQALLARIDRVEPRVRAWVTVDRGGGLADARGWEA